MLTSCSLFILVEEQCLPQAAGRMQGPHSRHLSSQHQLRKSGAKLVSNTKVTAGPAEESIEENLEMQSCRDLPPQCLRVGE